MIQLNPHAKARILEALTTLQNTAGAATNCSAEQGVLPDRDFIPSDFVMGSAAGIVLWYCQWNEFLVHCKNPRG